MSVVTDVPVSRHAVEAVALGAYPKVPVTVLVKAVDVVGKARRLRMQMSVGTQVTDDVPVGNSHMARYVARP